MSPHTRFVHEVFYWIEIALAPIACWLVWIVTKEMWRRGWLGDEWPDPPDDEPDLVAVQHPEAEPGEPAPWRR